MKNSSIIDLPPVFCEKHGDIKSWTIGAGTYSSGRFCPMCLGDWLTENFPVKEKEMG